MTVPQHEESALDATVINELSEISLKFDPASPVAKSILVDYSNIVERICGNIKPEQYSYLLDLIMILIEGLEILSHIDRNLSPAECAVLQKIPKVLNDYQITPNSNQNDDQLLRLLKNPQWIRPITNDEETELLASETIQQWGDDDDDAVDIDDVLSTIISDGVLNGTEMMDDDSSLESVDAGAEQDISENSEITQGMDPGQQELVDLVTVELAEIAETGEDLTYDLIKSNQEFCRNVIKQMADQAENISNAAKLIGLEGLSKSSNFISNNIDLLSLSVDSLQADQVLILKQWPEKLLKYLQNIDDNNAIAELLELLTNNAWIEVLDSAESIRIKQLLETPVFLEEENVQRQLKATYDDVDLSLPEDVNQELLDGLLQDLPTQTEEFSVAIQNISEGGGIENIDNAQRIAHTLKGAANVVGVNGIANLTHHLEDILQAQSKAGALPVKSLIDVLVRASDCLESMTETLLGINTQPEDAIDVLQEVLDVANQLDNAGITDGLISEEETDRVFGGSLNKDISHRNREEADSSTRNKQAPKSVLAENLLRIPVSLADEMLRVAGENLIYTSQIQEQINIIQKKQDAIDLHNHSLIQLSYDLEHLIDIQGVFPGVQTSHDDEMFDSLEMDEYHEVHTISRRLVEMAADSVQISQELDKDISVLKELVVNQNQLHKDGEELVLRTRMVPIKTIVPRLKRGVRQAGRLTGKQVELYVFDNNTFMDSEVLNGLIEPLMHILRNAIDHGIEQESDRLLKGKEKVGTIDLTFERKGNQVSINVIDDGKGLDTDDIYSKALSAGLIREDTDSSIENIQRLVLEPGFTTARKVTQTSGRGIGLDVVSNKVRELNGTIDISSNLGEGCKFALSIPVSSFSTHSLLVRSRQYIYAISSHGVEEILYPGMGEIRDIDGEAVYHLGSETYSVVLLDNLLSLPPDRREIERNVRPILLVKDEAGNKRAISVQEVIDSRDVVVKNMGNYIPKLTGIIGATVLGDGSVSPVIDLPEMLHENSAIHLEHDTNCTQDTVQVKSHKLPYVLVVDDSLSARRSLAQFVEDLGYSVRTARDGMEAISLIESRKPDLLLVDMEMPKMNGLELTSHVRATSDINNIPVIMITSRSTEKHRKAAIDKGVNHYMVKPFNEDELAQHLNKTLETA